MKGHNYAPAARIIVILAFVFPCLFSASPAQAQPDQKYLVMLRVVNHYVAFNELSWEMAAPTKTTDSFQWYEAAIFHHGEDQTANAVHLYKFDDTYDPWPSWTISKDAYAGYRETFRLWKVDIPAGLAPEERSRLIAQAFMKFFAILVRDTPSQHYGLLYSGHGPFNGALFEGEINAGDARWLMEHVVALLGRKMDILDMGTNCLEGRMSTLSNFYPYFDYMMASDLPVGGYQINPGVDFTQYTQDKMYPVTVTPDKTLRQGLVDLLDLVWQRWDNSDIDIIENQVMQSLSLFELNQYESMAAMTYQELTASPVDTALYEFDLLNYILSLPDHGEMESQFYALRSEYRSTKDFFPWNYEINGLSIWIPEWVEPDFSIFPPFEPVRVEPGGRVELDLLLRNRNGFDSAITVEALDVPPSFGVTISDVYGSEPSRVTLILTAQDVTPLGLHELQFSASGGGKTHTATAEILVAENISLYLPLTLQN